jgi:hypothetical protein
VALADFRPIEAYAHIDQLEARLKAYEKQNEDLQRVFSAKSETSVT